MNKYFSAPLAVQAMSVFGHRYHVNNNYFPFMVSSTQLGLNDIKTASQFHTCTQSVNLVEKNQLN